MCTTTTTTTTVAAAADANAFITNYQYHHQQQISFKMLHAQLIKLERHLTAGIDTYMTCV